MKRLKVTVDGTAYEVAVEVLDEGGGGLPLAMPPVTSVAAPGPFVAPATPPARRASAGHDGLADVRSPLGGKVVSVDAKPGQIVAEGQAVVTLEAMKMNTYIYAPKSGKVEAVHAHPGDAVEEGAVLLSIV